MTRLDSRKGPGYPKKGAVFGGCGKGGRWKKKIQQTVRGRPNRLNARWGGGSKGGGGMRKSRAVERYGVMGRGKKRKIHLRE